MISVEMLVIGKAPLDMYSSWETKCSPDFRRNKSF